MYRFEDQFNVQDDPVEQAKQLEAMNEKLKSIGSMARKCLVSHDFQQYKDTFEKEKDSIINAMVVYTANFGKAGSDNIEMYAINMIRFVQRISDLRKLLTVIEMDARKGLKTGESNGQENAGS